MRPTVDSLIPVGFKAKLVIPRPDFVTNLTVREILSVSGCMSEDAVDLMNPWGLNEWGLADTEEIIERAIERENVVDSRLRCFFYEGIGQELEEGEWEEIERLPTGVVRPASGYSLRGFDIVCCTIGYMLDCSPLSCNDGAGQFPVNEHCLLESFEEAVRVAEAIDESGKYEPPPYRVMSVWMKEP